MLQGKEILLATMHQKEHAISALMEDALGCRIVVPKDYDTDQFGTFCGEKSRFLSAKEMALHKAKVAMQQYSFEFAMASEGSFGSNPLIPFMPMHEELLVFVDSKNEIEIVVKKQTNITNYGMSEFYKNQSYDDFLLNHHFPSHGMIVRELTSNSVIAKGLQTFKDLEYAVEKAFTISEKIRLETDMRAMFNPTRMHAIKELTIDLIGRIKSHCADCGIYGFGEIVFLGNLPCSLCSSGTLLFQNMIEKCIRCDYEIVKPRSDGLNEADPTYCYYCNP